MTSDVADNRSEPNRPVVDPVAHLIEWHDGDARAAIATLLDDVRKLREQLTIAAAAISPGYTRGWMPDETADNASR